jgi:arginine decarboxylase-like protein
MFKQICRAAEMGDSWTPCELRTSSVRLMSHRGVSIEEIVRLVGHAYTRTTEVVNRRELRPVTTTGAEIMDEVFRRKLREFVHLSTLQRRNHDMPRSAQGEKTATQSPSSLNSVYFRAFPRAR